MANRRIAPLWDTSLTYRSGDGIFVDTSISGQATIRWQATNPADDSPINFAVVLFSDGRIRFDYGAGNAGLNPVVGISYGSSREYQYFTGYNGNGNLANVNSVLVAQSGRLHRHGGLRVPWQQPGHGASDHRLDIADCGWGR